MIYATKAAHLRSSQVTWSDLSGLVVSGPFGGVEPRDRGQMEDWRYASDFTRSAVSGRWRDDALQMCIAWLGLPPA